MATVKIGLAITQILQDGYISPKSPLFQVYNDGDVPLFINNFEVLPGDSFGVEVESIVAQFLDKEIEVINDTQYQLKFDLALAGANQRVSAQMIEIQIKKVA